jgi:hypothetical protein
MRERKSTKTYKTCQPNSADPSSADDERPDRSWEHVVPTKRSTGCLKFTDEHGRECESTGAAAKFHKRNDNSNASPTIPSSSTAAATTTTAAAAVSDDVAYQREDGDQQQRRRADGGWKPMSSSEI